MSDEVDRFLAHARGAVATARTSSGGVVMSLDELRARRGGEDPSEATWSLATMRGRLVELSARGATATLTMAMELVVEAQTQHEPVAWLTLSTGTFYPPDVAECGVDLAALVVVRAPDATAAARAAERILRSGAFGLVILDLGGPASGLSSRSSSVSSRGTSSVVSSGPSRAAAAEPRFVGNASGSVRKMPVGRSAGQIPADLSMQIQGRLVTLAQTHDAAVVCLTDKGEDTASLGSLVSLRAEALRARGRDEFSVTVRVLKDKRRGPGWTHTVKRRGPAGLL